MKAIKNISKFFDSLTDAILSQKDTYIFGYKRLAEAVTKRYKENPEQHLITSKSVSNAMQGAIFMTSIEDEHVYQVIPRKQQDFFDRGYYRCISPKNRNHYEEKVA